jgi:hypothetical protein
VIRVTPTRLGASGCEDPVPAIDGHVVVGVGRVDPVPGSISRTRSVGSTSQAYDIPSPAPYQDVVSLASLQEIGPAAADDAVIAPASDHQIGAPISLDDVPSLHSTEAVIAPEPAHEVPPRQSVAFVIPVRSHVLGGLSSLDAQCAADLRLGCGV